jgi:N-acetylmuramoyl-L-alanine amidase
MIKIALQSGHEGRTSGSTGAPGEMAINVSVRNRLSQLLQDRGFQMFLFNADPNKNATQKLVLSQDFDLFLSLHCDADYSGDNGGGFADYPEPSTDGATAESQRICWIINDVYFKETKIAYTNHSNANTRFYYMWQYISAKTPCVLIEMGQAQDPHDKVLLGNTELIATALARAICKAFSVPYEVVIETPPQVQPPTCNCLALENEIKTLKKALSDKQTELDTKLALAETTAKESMETYKIKIKQDVIKYIEEY